jgi:hypothetical protein
MSEGEISVGLTVGRPAPSGAVSATLFCAAMKVLRREWGERLTDQKHLNLLIGFLAEAEEAYRALPVPQKVKRHIPREGQGA